MRLLAIVLASAFALAACGEREQVMEGKRTYQGKRDTKAWENASASWTKGDKVSWEAQIKARQAGQNEYNRIGR